VFLVAISDVAKARGTAQLAKDAGVGRESLYKALAPGAKSGYGTVVKLIHALGIELHAAPAHISDGLATLRADPRSYLAGLRFAAEKDAAMEGGMASPADDAEFRSLTGGNE